MRKSYWVYLADICTQMGMSRQMGCRLLVHCAWGYEGSDRTRKRIIVNRDDFLIAATHFWAKRKTPVPRIARYGRLPKSVGQTFAKGIEFVKRIDN